MKRVLLLLLVAFLAAALPGQDTSSAGAALLFKLEAEFAQAVADHGRAAFAAHFAEDGVELDDGGGITTRDQLAKEPAWPEGTSLSWTPVKADMAASGDLGYTYGNYVFRSKGNDGKVAIHHGKYMSIWKKQKDGSWKVVADMGNSSPDPK